ncbi:MAG: hypothetical protein WBQ44_13860 [Rhodococcus sp. (in: high G+C Gram-positive bacteria)]
MIPLLRDVGSCAECAYVTQNYGRDDVDIAVGIPAVRHAVSLVDAAARLRAAAYAQSKPIGSLAYDFVHGNARFVL